MLFNDEAFAQIPGQLAMSEPERCAVRFGVFNRGVFHIADRPADNRLASWVTLCGKGAEGSSPCVASIEDARRIGRMCQRCEKNA